MDPILSPSRGKWNINSMREELHWLLWIQSNPMGENHILFYWFDLTPSIGKSRLKFGSLAKILDCKGIPFEHVSRRLSTNGKPRFWALDQSQASISGYIFSSLFPNGYHFVTIQPIIDNLNGKALINTIVTFSNWHSLEYHPTTNGQPLEFNLTSTWLPLDYHLTTTWLPLDCHLTTTCVPLDLFDVNLNNSEKVYLAMSL